jgi:hypothetical protein
VVAEEGTPGTAGAPCDWAEEGGFDEDRDSPEAGRTFTANTRKLNKRPKNICLFTLPSLAFASQKIFPFLFKMDLILCQG